jgi:hypothetical protein
MRHIPSGALMIDVYDKERTAALIKEARQISADLMVEMERIKIEMTRVLGDDEDAPLDEPEEETIVNDADFSGVTPPQSFWRFWR